MSVSDVVGLIFPILALVLVLSIIIKLMMKHPCSCSQDEDENRTTIAVVSGARVIGCVGPVVVNSAVLQQNVSENRGQTTTVREELVKSDPPSYDEAIRLPSFSSYGSRQTSATHPV